MPATEAEPAEPLLRAAVAVTLGAQAMVVLASLALPVTAAVVLPAIGLPAHVVGWYSSAVFVAGAAATLLTPRLVASLGAVRVHQGMLALAAAGLLGLAAGLVPALALSALLIGLAYGPANPASSALLSRLAPARLRNRVFSIKQVAVPLGGAAAGLVVPFLAARIGWQAAALGLAVVTALAALAVEPWRRRLDAGAAAPTGRQDLAAPFRAIGADGPALRLGGAALCYAAVQFSFSAFLPTVLVTMAGWSLAAAGATLTIALVVSIGARLVLGYVADRIAPTRVLLALGLAMALACAAAAAIGPGTPALVVFLIAGLFGFAAYGWNGVMLAEAARLSRPGQVAVTTAAMMLMVYAGATVGPALFGAAFAALGSAAAGFLLLGLLVLAPLAWLGGGQPPPR